MIKNKSDELKRIPEISFLMNLREIDMVNLFFKNQKWQ